MAAPTWLQDQASRVREVERDDGCVTIESYLRVAEGNPRIFEVLFAGPATRLIGGQLIQSNTDGVAQVRKDAGDSRTVQALVKQQVGALGVEACGKPGARNATKSILWLNRELTFICTMLRFMEMGQDAAKAAQTAYEIVLKPYHPWVVQMAVGAAMKAVPDLQTILEKLQLPSKEEGLKQVDEFCTQVEALSKEISAMLEQEKANFQGQA